MAHNEFMAMQNRVDPPPVESFWVRLRTKNGVSFWWIGISLLIFVLTWPNLVQLTSELSYLTARQMFQVGYARGAVWLLTQAEHIPAEQPSTYALAGYILYNLGDVPASQRQLEAGMKMGGMDSALPNNLAVTKYAQRDLDAAIQLLQQASVAAPNVAIPHYNLGVLSWQRGDSVAAARAFREAARIDPNWILPYLYLALIQMDLGKYAVAEEYAQKIITLQPDQSVGYELSIQALLAQKEGDLALAAISTAEAHISSQERLRLYHALAMSSTGEREASQIILEKLFRWTDDPSLRRRVAIELRSMAQAQP